MRRLAAGGLRNGPPLLPPMHGHCGLAWPSRGPPHGAAKLLCCQCKITIAAAWGSLHSLWCAGCTLSDSVEQS